MNVETNKAELRSLVLKMVMSRTLLKNIVMRFLATALMVGCFAPSVYAWGKKGHAVIAAIAGRNLTPTASMHVHELLSIDGETNMASVASWADDPSVKAIHGRPMHTVRMSMDAAPYNPEIDCKMRCAIKGIEFAKSILADRNSEVHDQIVALKDIIHLVGDIHQPLHTVSNIGGQSVILNGQTMSLHHVWDNIIIQDQGKSVRQLVEQLVTDQAGILVDQSEPTRWAVEGRDIAMTEIYSEVHPSRKSAPPTILRSDYTKLHWRTVEVRLIQAGLRLAGVINGIFDDK